MLRQVCPGMPLSERIVPPSPDASTIFTGTAYVCDRLWVGAYSAVAVGDTLSAVILFSCA